ncbi:MAG: SGNH/GDSL hydrolase family protein [Gemmatimonadaceae bacterium]
MKVLFVGNSFTARNDVPGLIARLAAARGETFEHTLISAGGASLRMHWNKGAALAAMRATRYDYVVLQEQSTLPVKNATRTKENIRLFDEEIRASGATMALYMTWAREHVPETQQAITDAYTSIGAELGALVIPVGIAWRDFLAEHDQPVLHDKDKSHPTLAGSYLAACVFFATLFGQSPVGIEIPVKGLTSEDARRLQAAAAL